MTSLIHALCKIPATEIGRHALRKTGLRGNLVDIGVRGGKRSPLTHRAKIRGAVAAGNPAQQGTSSLKVCQAHLTCRALPYGTRNQSLKGKDLI